MSLRTVGVRLVADISEYTAKMKAAAKSTEDVADEMDRTGKASEGLDKATRSATNLNKSVVDALGKVQKQAEAARQKLDALGNAATDAQIKQERAQLDLNKATEKYNTIVKDVKSSESDRADALNKVAAAQHKLEEAGRRVASIDLQRIKTSDILKSLPSPAEIIKAGGQIGENLGEGVKKSAEWAIKTPLIAVLGGAALAAAPFLGGVIAGAVIGGVGIGGVVGGVALAVQDSRVKDAGKTLGLVLLETFSTSAERHFVAPMLEAITKVQRWSSGMVPDLDRLFMNSSKFLEPLSEGLLLMLQRIIQGMADLTATAGPVVDAFASGFAQIGDALGDMFTDLGDNTVSAAAAIEMFFAVLTTSIRMITSTVEILTESYGVLAKLGLFGKEAQEEMFRLEMNAKNAAVANEWVAASLGGVRDAGKAAGVGVSSFVQALVDIGGAKGTAAATAKAHAEAMRDELGAFKELADAQRAEVDPLFKLLDAQAKVVKLQGEYGEAVKKHGKNSAEATGKLRDLGRASFDVQAAVGALSEGFDGKLTPTMLATFKAAGLTKPEIAALAVQIQNAKNKAEQYKGDYKGNFTAPGVVTSAGQIQNAWTKALGFDGDYKAMSSAPGAVKAEAQMADAWAQAKGFDGKYVASISTKGYAVTYSQLKNILIQQEAMAKGISVSAAKSSFSKQEAKAFARGGWTGPGDTYDEAGTVHADEFVIKKTSRRKIEAKAPGLLDRMNESGDLPGYAGGGRVMPFPVTTAKTKIMSLAEALAIVAPNIPSGGTTYPWIIQMAKAMVPGIQVLSSFRKNATTLSGNRSYHAAGQAVDFAPSESLARQWNQRFGRNTNELITPYQKYNLWNGKKHTYTGAIWNQHNFAGGNAHDHIAVSGSLGGGGGGSMPGGSLAAWIARALALTKTPTSWTPYLNTLIKRESGGNPNAVNRTDSNARAGHPSQGLMQTIPSTFSAYRLKSLPNNILDPVANIVAGIRYIKARYGSIFNVQQANASKPPKGYANGGLINEPITGVGASGRRYTFGEYGPETVIPGNKTGWMSGGGGSSNVSNTFQINVNVPPTANKAEVGREVVLAIQDYERGSGKKWRS